MNVINDDIKLPLDSVEMDRLLKYALLIFNAYISLKVFIGLSA